jgi:predicted ATPase
MQTARDVAARLWAVAQLSSDTELFGLAHYTTGVTLYYLGEWSKASEHLECGLATYDEQRDQATALFYSEDRSVTSLCHLVALSWGRGYPEQAQHRLETALDFAWKQARPLSLARAWSCMAALHYCRHEWPQVQVAAKAMLELATEHGFPFWKVVGALYRGAALVAEGQTEEGLGQLRQELTRYRSWGAEITLPYFLAVLADAERASEHTEEGLVMVTEALAVAEKTGQHFWEAELHRLRGELTLQQFKVQSSRFKVEENSEFGVEESQKSNRKSQKSKISDTQSPVLSTQSLPFPQAPSLKPLVSSGAGREAEGCFLKAINIARKQEAKSLELRAVMSLVRLRQLQASGHVPRSTQHESCNSLAEAHTMLSAVYNWFTEGFDTKDLQEAKALLDELSR